MQLRANNLNADFARFCREPRRDRAELFTAVANTKSATAVAIEKDFHVCRTIDAIFHGLPFRPKPFFKGGTSLSKGYGLIDRFSEDIDIIISPAGLGLRTDPADPKLGGEAKKRVLSKSSEKGLPQKLQKYTHDKMREGLQKLLSDCAVEIAETPDEYGAALTVTYESVLPRNVKVDAAIKRSVLIETGGRSAREPAEVCDLEPYIQQKLNDDEWNFRVPKVCVITPRRTFWDKVFIVNSINRRAAAGKLNAGGADRKSRHHYDLAKTFGTVLGTEALADLDLFKAVHAAFRADAKAIHGSFKIVPKADVVAALRKDYDEGTTRMIFGRAPTFDWVIEKITELENALNKPPRQGRLDFE